jgi:hypothetical protein
LSDDEEAKVMSTQRLKNVKRWSVLVLCLVIWSAGFTAGCDEDEGAATQDTSAQADTQDQETSPDTSGSTDDTTTAADAEDLTSSDGADANDADDADTATPPPNPDCDPLVPSVCALPWPSNLYLAPDTQRVTGSTLRFLPTSLPANSARKHIDPAPWTRMDGYGVGTMGMVLLPDIDLSALPSEADPSSSLSDESLIWWVKLDAAGDVIGRVPYWVELDTHAASPERQLLFIRPAALLEDGTRYAIVLRRGLKPTTGAAFEPSEAFAKLVANQTADDPQLKDRQPRFDALFTALEKQSIARADLLLAWDFVTASSAATHGPLLSMIDDAFAATGDDGPALTVTKVEPSVDGDRDFADTAYRIEGTFEVPHFMKSFAMPGGDIGWVFNLNAAGVPTQDGTRTATWRARIPRAALDGTPQSLIMYGHGLLGTSEEVNATWSEYNAKIGNTYGAIHFGADMTGMSEADYGNVVLMLQDFSTFPIVADRLHQGMTEWQLLARAMPRHFDSVVTQINQILGESLTITRNDELFYSGISQGGIFGATFMALSKDITRGHLGVPGNNYSTLLHRSADFTTFFQLLKLYYRDPIDQAIALATIQILWDSTDPVSYYRHLKADPFAGYPAHEVLLAPAKGDWQVAVVTNEVVARSGIGIPLMSPYDVTRTPPLAELQPYGDTGHAGSGVVLYDFGNPWPAPGNHTPDPDGDGECDRAGGQVCDPHSSPRRHGPHSVQMMTFFRDGLITDVCGGDGCTPD